MSIISYICWRLLWFLTCWRQVLWMTSTERQSFVHGSHLARHSEWELSSLDPLTPCCHSKQSHCIKIGIANFILYFWTVGDCRKSYWCLNQAGDPTQFQASIRVLTFVWGVWVLLISAVSSCVLSSKYSLNESSLCNSSEFSFGINYTESEYSLDGTRWFYSIKT